MCELPPPPPPAACHLERCTILWPPTQQHRQTHNTILLSISQQQAAAAAPLPPPPPPPTGGSTLRPSWVLSGAAAAVAAVVGLIWAWRMGRKAGDGAALPLPPLPPQHDPARSAAAEAARAAVHKAGEHLAASHGDGAQEAAEAVGPLVLAAETGGAVDETAAMSLEQLQSMATDLYLIIQQVSTAQHRMQRAAGLCAVLRWRQAVSAAPAGPPCMRALELRCSATPPPLPLPGTLPTARLLPPPHCRWSCSCRSWWESCRGACHTTLWRRLMTWQWRWRRWSSGLWHSRCGWLGRKVEFGGH